MSVRRARRLIMIAVAAGLLFAGLALIAASASATTIYVDDSYGSDTPASHQWTTVQKGVYDAAAGDTVYVYNGLYLENVTIWNNSITVQGESRTGAVIDKQSLAVVPVINVKGNHVTLQNLTLKRGSYGVYADQAAEHNGTLDNLTILQHNYDCVYLAYAHDWLMHDIDVSSCGYSGFDFAGNPNIDIRMWSIAITTVTNYDGMTIGYTTGLWASNLTISAIGRAGIWVQYSADVHISGFTINSTSSYGGVYFYYQVDQVSLDNGTFHTTNGWAVYAYDADYGSLDNLTMDSASYGGVEFNGLTAYWKWRNVQINTTGNAFYLYYSSPISLPYFQHDIDLSNTIRGTPIVYLVNATGTTFSGAASFLAVVNCTSVDVTVTNVISAMDWGVVIAFTNTSTIHDINSSGNGWNYVIERSFNNTFTNFTQTYMRPSYSGGIYLYAASNNLFDGGLWRNASNYAYAIDVRAGSGANNNTFANISCSGWNTCFFFGTSTEGNRVTGSNLTLQYYAVYASYATSFTVDHTNFTGVWYYAVYAYVSSGTVTNAWVHNNTFNHTQYYYAVYLQSFDSALVENNLFNDSSIGIYGYDSDAMVVRNNVFNASRDVGVRGDYSNFWQLYGNIFTNWTNSGLYLQRSSFWTMRSNQFINRTAPIYIYLDANVQVQWATHDADTSNLVNGLPLLWVTNATSGTWNGSYGGIIVDNSSNISVTSTSPLARNYIGLLLVGVNDSAFNYLNASANTYGFEAWLSHRNTIGDSTFGQNTAGGLYFWGSDWNVVTRSVLRPDAAYSDYGFDLDGTSNNDTFESSDCSGFSTCIYVRTSAANLRVYNSTLNASYYGVYSNALLGPIVLNSVFPFNYYYSIYFGYGGAPYTSGYRIANNTMGQTYYQDIYCYYCQSGSIEDNALSSSDYGIYLYFGQGGLIARNRISNMATGGIGGTYHDYLILLDNLILNGTGAGIRIDYSRFWYMRGNNITNETAPIRFSFPDPIPDMGYGMHDVDASNLANGQPIRFWVNATGVSFTGSAGLIIATNSSALNITATNPVTRGQAGIFLMFVNGSTFFSTNLSTNEWGTISYHSNNNTFSDLTVWRNTAGGAYFEYSEWNLITGGNFTPDAAYGDYGVQFNNYARNNTVSTNITNFYAAVYSPAGTSFDSGIDGGTYSLGYYGFLSYSYGGARAEHAVFQDNYYQQVYFQGGGGWPTFGRIANNTFHRGGYDAIYLYNFLAGTIADNLMNGSGRWGIYVQSSSGLTIFRNTILNVSDYAVYAYSSSSFEVTSNTITRDVRGLYLQESRYWTFVNNSFFNLTGAPPWSVYTYSVDPIVDVTLFMHTWTTDNLVNGQPVRYYVNQTGITFLGAAGWLVAVNCTFMDLGSTTSMDQNWASAMFVKVFNSTIRGGVANNSYAGAFVSWGADNRIYNFRSNASSYAIYLSNSTRTNIDGAYVSNFSTRGVYIGFSPRVNVTNSTFYRGYIGFDSDAQSQFINITSCLFDGQSYIGIYPRATDDVHIVGNTINGVAYYGLYTEANSGDHADRLVVSRNWFNNGGYYDAIVLYYAFSALVDSNLITNSSNIAIQVSQSNANTIRNNTIRYQGYGFYVGSSASNTFIENTVSNSSYTLYLDGGAQFNEFYHNNFYTSAGAFYDVGTSNTFDNGYPSGGNFWSNTTHTDIYRGAAQATAGPDGINDTAMNLPYGRRDSYPLSEPWPPHVTLLQPANLSVIIAGVTLQFNISFYFDTVQYAFNNGTTVNLTSPWNISTTGLSDGDLFLRIWANDSTGFTLVPNYLFVIDSTAPSIVVDSPTVGGTYPVGTQLNFTVSDAHLVGNVTWNNGSGNNSFTAPWDLSTAGWAEGDYNITIRAWDAAGNAKVSTFLFKLDSTAPAITLVSPSNGSFISAGTTIDLLVSDVHLSSVTWNNGSGANALVAPFDISTTGWGSATWNITVIANDTAGFSTTRVFTFTIDAVPPTITLNSPTNNSVFDPGATLDFTVSDTNLGAVTYNLGSGPAAFTAPWDISTSGWADGAYNVTIVANDTAGNSAVAVFHFEVDSLAPVITTVFPSSGAYISGGQTADFSVADPHFNTATWSNGSGNNAITAPFDVSLAGWADGAYTIVVNASDVLGHTSSRSVSFTIDSVGPTVVLNSPSNNSYFVAGRTLDFSAGDTNLATVVSSNGGAFSTFASPYDISTTGMPDGTLTVRVNATDLAGNFLNISFSFTVDSTAPSVFLNSPSNNSYFAAGRTLDFGVTETNLASVVSSTGGAYTTLASAYDISTGGLPDGAITVRLNATDLAGNFVNISFAFTIDSTLPTVVLNTPSNNSYFAAGRTLDFSVADTNLASVVSSNGGAYSALGAPYDLSTTGWADGAYTVRVNATDLAGNFVNMSFSFTVDSTAPSVFLNSPSNNSYFAAGRTLDFGVTETNLASAVSSTGGAYTTLASPYDISTGAMADGSLTVRINATDLAGNFVNISFAFTVDSTQPTVALNTPSSGQVIRAGTTLDFSVSDANLQSVVSSTGGAYTALGSPYDISTAAMADGAITVRINATDLAGNFRNVSFSFTIDSTAPTVSLVSPSAGSYFAAGRTLDFAVSDTNLQSVVSSTGGAYTTFASPYDLSTSAMADGALTVRINATDAAGNFQNVSFSFTVDSTAPTVTLNGPASPSTVRAGVTLDFSVADTNLQSVVWSNGGAYTNLSSPYDVATTSWADGSYTVRVNATDLAGNFRNVSFSFDIDSTNPAISLASPSAGSTVRAGTVVVLSITDAHLVNTTYERIHNNASMGITPLGAPFQIDTTGWSDGDTIIVHADDAAGNSANYNVPLALDSTAPSVVLVSPLNGSVVRAGTMFIWSVSDPAFQNASIFNGTVDSLFTSPFTVNSAGYFDRNYNFTVVAFDAAGNNISARFNFTVDSTPPQVQLFSPANNSWLQAGAAIDFGVSDLHLTGLSSTLDGAPVTLFAGYDYNSNNLTDGTHTFVLNATDAAGNTRSLAAVFRVDKTPPTIAPTPANNSVKIAGTPWNFVITEPNIQTAQYATDQDARSFQPFSPNFTINTSTFGDGRYAYVVRVTDLAGNVAEIYPTLFIDSSVPDVTLMLPPGTKYVRSGVDIVFHVANENFTLGYAFFVGGNPVTLVEDGTGNYAFTFPAAGFAEGANDLDLSINDMAGNVFHNVWPMILDNTAPVLNPPFPMAYGGNEDMPFQFHGEATDAALDNGDPLSYEWLFDSNGPRPLSLDNVTGQDANWTFTTPGQYDVTVIVSDPAGNANNTTFSITVFDVTPPSMVINRTFLSVAEDTPFSISQTSIDNGNGTLNWTWRAPAANLTSNGPNITWIFTTPGVYNITVTVRDPSNNTAQGYVIVDVQDITPPNATIVGPTVSDVLISVVFSANATDNDPRYGPANWAFSWKFIRGSDVTTKTGQNVTYIDSESGAVTVELNVTDASGNRAHVVTHLDLNKPPTIGTQPPTEAGATEPWVWSPNITDPENAGTNISIVDGPPGMTVTTDGQLVWTPGAGDVGQRVNVTVAYSDGLTTVLRTFTVLVVDPARVAGNHRPVFESDPPTDASVSKTYLYDIIVTDADGDIPTILISGLDGYTYDEAQHRLSWNPPWQPSPNEVFERLVPVTITAFDGKQSTSQDFIIRFRNPPNRWPEYVNLFTINDQVQGSNIRIKISDYWHDADDADFNLTFVINDTDRDVRARVPTILGWRVIREGSDTFIVFNFTGAGVVTFNLSARDPSGARSENATVTVKVAPGQAVAGFSLPWWFWIVLIGGIGAGGAGLFVALRRSRAAGQVAQSALDVASRAPTERVVIQQAAAGAEKRKDTYVIEGVFVIYQDGRMIFSKTDASDVKLEDPELVASMFSAVQSFIKDSFQATGELNRLGFGENTILIERGTAIFMAAIIFGEPQDDLFVAMKETVRTIENAYAGIIEEWDGSTTSLEAIDQYVLPFLALTAARSRADVKAAMTEKIVKMLSELEFFQGFVRLKCGVKNDTESVITKVTVAIDFNEDVLRLHHIEPTTYKVQGSETQLGVLNPGEKVSVAYYFDPQICTESQIDGTARYRDAKGAVHSLSMKTRKAEVVCPIFFTKEHANTAMLKRLVEGELDQRDSKVYNVMAMPEKMTYEELFSLAKEVVLAHDVHLVRDFIKQEPYHGEAWFYGETKVKGYKIVIRASVMEDGKRIEFFAASTAIPAITGLLAEFNHTLIQLIGRKHATLKLESEFDEQVKVDIQKKSLMAKMSAGELEGGETDQEP